MNKGIIYAYRRKRNKTILCIILLLIAVFLAGALTDRFIQHSSSIESFWKGVSAGRRNLKLTLFSEARYGRTFYIKDLHIRAVPRKDKGITIWRTDGYTIASADHERR